MPVMTHTSRDRREDRFLKFSTGPTSSRDVLCVICQRDVEQDEACITHKECGQCYHKDCLERWACAAQASIKPCPYCRGLLGPYMTNLFRRMGPSVEPVDPVQEALEAMTVPDTFIEGDGPEWDRVAGSPSRTNLEIISDASTLGNRNGEWVIIVNNSNGAEFLVHVPLGLNDLEIAGLVDEMVSGGRGQPTAREQVEYEERAPTVTRSNATRQPAHRSQATITRRPQSQAVTSQPRRVQTVVGRPQQPETVTPRSLSRRNRDMPPNSFLQAFSSLSLSTRSRRSTGSRLAAIATQSPQRSSASSRSTLNRLQNTRRRLLADLDDVNDRIERLEPSHTEAESPDPYVYRPGPLPSNNGLFNFASPPPSNFGRSTSSADTDPQEESFFNTLNREASQLSHFRSLRVPRRRNSEDERHSLDLWALED